MDFIKKQSVSTWISVGAFIIAFVAIILFGVNASSGYFAGVGSAPVVAFGIIALLALVVVIILAQLEFDGLVGKIVKITCDVIKIIIPMFLMICVLSFLSTRMEGLAYIFGSNQEILDTIQTPENLSSAYTAIVGFIFFGVASLATMVSAFFELKKKDA